MPKEVPPVHSDRDGDAIGMPSVATNPITDTPWFRLLFWGGLVVGAALLLLFPLAKPLWTDEVISLWWGESSLQRMAAGKATSRDHTPTHAFILYMTRYFFGDNLSAYRLVSALPAMFTPYIAFLLGRRVNLNVGLLALWLVALAPGSVLFDRMARYHALLALLVTWSTYLFLRCLGTGKKKLVVGYTVVTLAMLMVYVPSLFVVVGHFLTLALNWKREKHAWKAFIAMVICGACLLPVLLWQMDPSTGMVSGGVSVENPEIGQGVGGFIRRVALPVYVYCVGETVYPWSWAASIPGVVIALVSFCIGTMYVRRTRDIVLPIVLVVTTFMFALATSGKIGALQTFGSMGKRNAFLIPLFCVTVATGLMALRTRALRITLTAILFAVWGYANFNYWTGREFLNPTYTAPWNAVMSRMEAEGLRENAMIITDEDVIDYTLGRGKSEVPIVMPQSPGVGGWGKVDITMALAAERKGGRRYIYFIGRDRGNRIAVDLGDKVCEALAEKYTCVYAGGYMKRSETEKYWLEKVLKRPTPPYYIWIKRFDTESPADRLSVTGNESGKLHP
ncbi:MAG: glycosyltransferase family 39 protein [Akkermansiaceae bacterium]|nr:glycosyltransferase family 39 protein [Armatimonadota bacterium]